MTTQRPKVLKSGTDERVITVTRTGGTGALRTGDRYAVGSPSRGYLGTMTYDGRRGGMAVWEMRAAGSANRWHYTGPTERAAWSLAAEVQAS